MAAVGNGDNAEEQKASLAAVAEALSHDIKGSIGTIGMQFRLAKRHVTHLQAAHSIDDVEASAHANDIESWIKVISQAYDHAEALTNAVRSGEIHDRSKLKSEIGEKIEGPVSGLILTLDRRTTRLRGRPSSDLLKNARKATFRVQRILQSIILELDSDGELEFVNTNLRNRATQAVEQLSEKVGAIGATINITGVASVAADQNSILTMYINLIDNALVYVEEGVTPVVDIALGYKQLDDLVEEQEDLFYAVRKPNRWAVVTIADNGVGIAEEDRDQVFEMGFRASNELDVDGSGFGLYRVKSIVRRHRGRIALGDSRSGGLEVRIYLPSDPAHYLAIS